MKSKGLSEQEVIESRKKHGSNALVEKKPVSFLKLFIESLGDPIIKILLIALAIKVIFLIKSFDWYETIGIVIAIFLASFISSISEYGSNKAFEALKEEASKLKCKVKRNGKIIEINIDDVVVDDIVVLSVGDKVPADGCLIDGSISLDESSLNGESKEKYKYKNDKVLRGSIVASGMGSMLVTSVGIDTFYGRLSLEIQEEQPETPLKLRLRNLAKIISRIGYVGAFFVFFSYLFSVIVINNNFDINLIKDTVTNFRLMSSHVLYALTLCVTIIVVAVPEGLPMMITLVLSSNMKRMVKDNVLVRKMMGIETSGSLNLLFTDKTGTLTKGKLEVIRFITPSLKEYDSIDELKNNKPLYNLVTKSFCLNNESVYSDNKIVGGNITDRALLKFVGKNIEGKVVDRVLFSSKNKYSKVVLEDGYRLMKGAYEVLLPKCNYYYDDLGNRKYFVGKNKVERKIEDISKRGIRVIAFVVAYKNEVYGLLGFAYLKDEIRQEAIKGIELVKNAGIDTIMITGDNKDTAYAIGMELGLIEDTDLVVTSEELSNMSVNEIKSKLPRIRIVARSLPSDKSRLVTIAQQAGYVVGMTGDGVNDAPALKKADVGFSMGSGTEIAKEASDIIILDDNFLSISKAILYGRTIFKSIRKFIILQLTSNFCALSLSILGPFIGVSTPVTVIQMLWINMVMDTLAGLAFSYEPALLEYMYEPPKKKTESIINKYMINQIVVTGLYSSLLCILFLKLPIFYNLYRKSGTDKYFMTAFFALLIFIDVFNAFNARTHRLNILSNLKKNKVFILIIVFILAMQIVMIYYGGSVFRTSGLTLKELIITILFAFSVVPVDNIRKILLRSRGINKGV